MGSNDNTVKLWDVTSGECLQTLEGHPDSVDSVSFSQMGRSLSGSWQDGEAVDVTSGVSRR